jgi:hypothetical protein
MKRPALIYIFILFSITACKFDSDIIATYKDGKITRGEFTQWLKNRNIPIDAIGKDRETVKNELQMLAMNNIALIEAQKENFEKSERFTFLFDDIKTRYLGSQLLDDIIEEKGFKENCVKLQQIVLKIEGKTDVENNQIYNKAKTIIDELDKSENFSKLAKKYSDHPSGKIGGETGYLIKELINPDYADIVMSMAKGSYTREPINIMNKKVLYILKVEDKKIMTNDNLDDLIPDTMLAVQFRKIIFSKAKRNLLATLSSANDVTFDENAALLPYPQAVIFTIGDNKFTVGDLTGRIDMINKITGIENTRTGNELKKHMATEFYHDQLLKREAERRGINNNSKYQKRIKEAREAYLAGDYLEFVGMKDTKVTPAEVRQEYDRFKYARYFKEMTVGGNKFRAVKPFDEVKDGIELNLVTIRKLSGKSIWMKKMFKAYDFKILDKEIDKGK